MIDIVCPQCSTESRHEEMRRNADSFCPVCDYPLFWAVAPAELAAGDGGDVDHRRRLPGVAGRALLVTVTCWSCSEVNPADRPLCVRCGSDLAGPPPVAEPEPVVVVAEPVLVEPDRSWLPWLLVGGFLLLTLVAALVALNSL